MFSAAEREGVRARLLDRARADENIVAAAVTGSSAAGAEDAWSDVDLSFGITDGVEIATVIEDWTALLEREFGALHHWDLVSPTTTFRVFLLPLGLEVDLGFTPQAHFASRGPRFRPVFGEFATHDPSPPPAVREEIGLGWHHVLHARACIERGRPWQAEWLISAIRDHVITLACIRLGLEPYYARGADRLPPDMKDAVKPTLVRDVQPAELRRALRSAADALVNEVRERDAELAARLAVEFAQL
jgi:predicted nucleotidyltransferase